MAVSGGDEGDMARRAFDFFAWDRQLRMFGAAAEKSLFGFGAELELGMSVCGERRSIVAKWIGCGAHRDVYRGWICGLDNLGAFVVKIGTSVREENANLTEWVNFHEHGFSQCITPLVYGETTIEHESASGRGGRVTVLVESAVVLAEVGLEEFLYDLVRADSMGWDRAVSWARSYLASGSMLGWGRRIISGLGPTGGFGMVSFAKRVTAWSISIAWRRVRSSANIFVRCSGG